MTAYSVVCRRYYQNAHQHVKVSYAMNQFK